MEGIGTVDKIWIGYATDQEIRLNSASGGIVTGALVALLESGDIDGAVVNTANLLSPPNGKSILATTKDELMKSAKSIYCMTEIDEGLKKTRNNYQIRKIAVVGLPCQISALKQNLVYANLLRDKIVVCIGIMCGHNMLSTATDRALRKLDIDLSDVRKVTYRARGWFPFHFSVEMKDDSVKEFPWADSPLQKTWDALEHLPNKCKSCSAFAAEDADIACCDAWLDEYRGNQDGYSIVLTHTALGTEIVEALMNKDILNLNPGTPEDLYRSNYMQIDRKLAIKGN